MNDQLLEGPKLQLDIVELHILRLQSSVLFQSECLCIDGFPDQSENQKPIWSLTSLKVSRVSDDFFLS